MADDQTCITGNIPGSHIACDTNTFSHDKVRISDATSWLHWAPQIFIWTVAPTYLYLSRLSAKLTSHNGMGNMVLYVGLFQAALYILQMLLSQEFQDLQHAGGGLLDLMFSGVLFYLTRIFSLVLISIFYQSDKSQRVKLPLFVFWTLSLASEMTRFYFNMKPAQLESIPMCDVFSFSHVIAAIFQLGLLNSTAVQSTTHEIEAHPEDLCSVPGGLIYSWVTRILWKGYRQGLQETDIPKLAVYDRCKKFFPAFIKAWNKELKRLEHKKDAPTVNVLFVLFKHFGFRVVLYQLIKLLFEMTQFVQPVLMGQLIEYFKDRETEPIMKGYMITIAIFIWALFNSTCHVRIRLSLERLAKHMKICLKMSVYRKALTAKNQSRQYLTTSEVISLVTEDCEKVINASNTIFFIINTPIKIGLSVYILYQHLGVGAFVALVIMTALIPINTWVGHKLKSLEKKKEAIKAKRIKMINEIVNGIKVLKLYAWEKPFLNKIMNIRQEEVDLHGKIYLFHAGIDLVICIIPLMVRVGSFMTFIYLGGHMDPVTAIITSTLFTILNHPFGLMTSVIPELVQASTALGKVNKFLNLDNLPDDIVIRQASRSGTAIEMNSCNFTWGTSENKICIENINLLVAKGKLTAVVGKVGSGKSSLLSAMLGEMEKLDGEVKVDGSTAYVPQEAWILNTSLRENILFGSQFDNLKYTTILKACALKDDLTSLASGDDTLIGEKGINLSGGQKQRVSLARAVYNDADIYLLDDPLSSVDSHVGKQIFGHVIGGKGLLKDKTRVMVTHAVQWLPYVDNILLINAGRIVELGTYAELIKHSEEFKQFVRDNNTAGTSDFVANDESVHGNGDGDDVKFKEDDIKIKGNSNQSHPISSSGNDITKESKLGGNVYLAYLKAVGIRYFILCMFLFGTCVVVVELNKYELARWADDEFLSNVSLSHTKEYRDKSWSYLYTFTFYGFLERVVMFMFITLVMLRGSVAATFHHNQLLNNVLRLPMSFHDVTPSARIITRFSKDITSVDGLGFQLRGYIRWIGWLLCGVILVIFTIPGVILYMIPITIICLSMQNIFDVNTKQIRRYKASAAAPIFVQLSETLNGLDSVRAYGVTERFIETMELKLEEQMQFDMTEQWFGAWYEIRLTFLSSFITMVSILLLLQDLSVTAGTAGLILGRATSVISTLGHFFRHSTNAAAELVSLERVIEYSCKTPEAQWESGADGIRPEWPSSGELHLEDYKARYRDGLDLVLKGVTCHIKSGEKIGIVGRTGAGKSSIAAALFRLIEATAGKISLDGQHIEPIGLHDLRKNLTILPQDPVIFGGSLRMNLDPFNEHPTDKSSEALWLALKHARLDGFVNELPDQLDYDCGEGGKNLSHGQRQLVCLARALLRNSHVLILDEATAAVDMETDDAIQATIRSKFTNCTVLTIAHRLNTILDYDRIMVLDSGLITEMGSPKELLENHNSHFHALARDAGLV